MFGILACLPECCQWKVRTMKCTNPQIGRLITRYELGALDESEREAFVDHLIQCEYCHNEVYSMAPFMSRLRECREAVQQGEVPSDWAAAHRVGTPHQPPLWLRRPILAAAALLVALGVGLLAFYSVRQFSARDAAEQPPVAAPATEVAKATPPAWQDVPMPKAPYTPPDERPVLRGTEPGSAFERAMAAYQQNHFAAAAEQLEVISRLEPEHAEAHFYWGVSLLLAGRSGDAIGPLKQAVQLNAGAQRASSHYYLALAYLKTNRPQSALAELEAVMEMNERHRAEAEKLKQRIVAGR
jgi:tetratricopeptide (TPR) repeat protein